MLNTLTVAQARRQLDEKQISSTELTRACLDQIQGVDDRVRAFLEVTAEKALERAAEADQILTRPQASKGQPMLGIPIAMKDNTAVKGQLLSCSSKILEGFVSPYDATVTQKLKNAGAILLGRLNMDEFAMGSSTENSAFQTTVNPWSTDCIPGGSSGGSAAAVAAHECLASIGSDTGGSIRQPASLCGCVGFKPTYGRVSRYGLVAFASSLDQIGPLTKTVGDAATLLEVICGHDPMDSTSVPQPVPSFTDALTNPDIKGVRIGLPKEFFVEGLDPEVREKVHAAVRVLEGMGAEIKEISLPHTDYGVATYYIIATAEASANLARFDGIRYGLRVSGKDPAELYSKTRAAGFGSEVKRRIILGTYVLSSGYYDAYYIRAQKVRTLIRQDFDKAFQEVDVIATPTTPTPAFKKGEKASDPLQMYLSDVFTISCNLAGNCGISVPCGFSQHSPRLPVGLQLLGRNFEESTILKIAHAYEQSQEWHKDRAPIVSS